MPPKTLVYTVSDFSELAEECINMLVDSMEITENIDFCVVANKFPSPSFKHNVIRTRHDSNYIGFLKYFPELPDYEQYIYLDSDILFFGPPLKLVSDANNFSIVIEKEGSLRDQWHSFHISNKRTIPNVPGLNAGTFAFKDKQFLTEMSNLLEAKYNPNYSKNNNAKLEQSIFNFFIGEKYNFNWTRTKDITDVTKLHVPDNFEYNPSILIYHFCGWTGGMKSKHRRMTNFLNKNQHVLNK
jgi:hypothetical protein